MRKIILFFFVLSSCFTFAQQKQSLAFCPQIFSYGLKDSLCIGVSNIRIRYAFQPQDLANVDTWIDCGQLLYNDSLSQYSSYFLAEHVKALKQWLRDNPNKSYYPNGINFRGRRNGVWSEYQYSQILIHNNELEEWAVMPLCEPQQWIYSEQYPSMSWTLSTDTTTICGYLCQKATCCWRGWSYIAWFATQLPIKLGPWKFGGLPGLIMKIYDTKHLYTWQAVAIEDGVFPILQLRKKYFKKTTRSKVRKMQYDYNVKFAELVGVRHGPQGIPVTTRYHYDQLELE